MHQLKRSKIELFIIYSNEIVYKQGSNSSRETQEHPCKNISTFEAMKL